MTIDMNNLISLFADENSIEDLTGLEYAQNLRALWLRNNNINDISPLAYLTDLWLGENNITNISSIVERIKEFGSIK